MGSATFTFTVSGFSLCLSSLCVVFRGRSISVPRVSDGAEIMGLGMKLEFGLVLGCYGLCF